ncbi:MAG: helix-turn-helix transcriptional regulator [Chitinophagaceae bacterium]|jgi:transcriptional regulator with XRE-family HTH domain
MSFEAIKIKDVKETLGEWIKGMRKEKNLSQDELAIALNLSRITIQNLESGKNITIDTLLKVLQYFDALDSFHQYISSESQNNSYKSLY